jgi:hypothetical protein
MGPHLPSVCIIAALEPRTRRSHYDSAVTSVAHDVKYRRETAFLEPRTRRSHYDSAVTSVAHDVKYRRETAFLEPRTRRSHYDSAVTSDASATGLNACPNSLDDVDSIDGPSPL